MMKLMLKLLLICLFSSLVISATFDCKGKQDGFYKDPENPHIFFECTGGMVANFTCPENLVFDETLKACDFIHSPSGTTTAHTIAPLTTVPTTQKATTAAPTTKATTAAPTTQATTAAPTTKATTSAPTTQATTAPPTHSPTYDCTGKPDGYHKDPDNPHKFFQCATGKAFEFTCPEGLVFDETIKTCAFGGTPDPKATTHTTQPTPHITPSTAGTTKPSTQPTPNQTTKETTHPNVTPTQSGTTAAQTTKGADVTTTQKATEPPIGSTNTLRVRHTNPPV